MILDLSLPIAATISEPDSPRIRYYDHAAGAKGLINGAIRVVFRSHPFRGFILFLIHRIRTLAAMAGLARLGRVLPPFVSPGDFPGGMALANEDLRLDTHVGTHLDAPWHFGPTAGGARARTIDEVPLEWCYGDGVVLDLRHKQPGAEISRQDIADALLKIGYSVKPLDIILIMTGSDRHYGKAEYFTAHPGMSRDATLFLLEQGVKIIGIDAWGFDRPAMRMLSSFLETRDNAVLFPAHFAGRDREYCHIEKLANLDKIPRPAGFKFACFPVKVEKASAAWCRAVAIL